MVIPDSFYKSKKNSKKIHQAHTFALSRTDKLLTLYDINQSLFYEDSDKCFDNYKFVINYLKNNRMFTFFSDKFGKKNNFKSSMPNFDKEGICFIYIKELEEKNAIMQFQTPKRSGPIHNLSLKISA